MLNALCFCTGSDANRLGLLTGQEAYESRCLFCQLCLFGFLLFFNGSVVKAVGSVIVT